MSLAERRYEIKNLVLRVLKDEKDSSSSNFRASFTRMKPETLFEETVLASVGGWTITELFTPRQGVTWGGQNCESIFVIGEKAAADLESAMIYKTIGGKDIRPGKIEWTGESLVFPYIARNQRWISAFLNPNLGGVDSLDFDENLDHSEKGREAEWKLKERIARKWISFPKTAEYLFSFYDTLRNRIFKNKPLSDFNKMWYEYIWQRDPSITAKGKIVTPRLTKEARFAIDNYGYLPRDSVISLLPKGRFSELTGELSEVVGKRVSDEMALRYVLVFLNSRRFNYLLTSQRAKKRGGYPMVGEKTLGRFTIPRPQKSLLNHVESILSGTSAQKDIEAFFV